ncbi:MAG TPA: hypothetical protein VF023_02890 [Bryobacteraceae bacterium]
MMGFALWIDEKERLAWAQGRHEYRPMGTAVIAVTDQFRHSDFRQTRRIPSGLHGCFVGFFGSLETVNEYLALGKKPKLTRTPGHLF